MILAFLLLVIIFFGSLCYLFFCPFYLEIDTTKNLFRIRAHHFASARLLAGSESNMLEIKILGWKKHVTMFTQQAQKATYQKQKNKNKKTSFPEISLKKIKRILGSFKINQCRISIDTGDVQFNAFLFPIFYLLQLKTNKFIQINFIDNIEIQLEIENSLARMSWAYIRS